MTKQELLDLEGRRWHELCARLDRIEDWAGTTVSGEWTAKDVVAHVAVWHALSIDRLEALRMTGELPRVEDVDGFNDEQFKRNRDLDVHDVKVMSNASRHRFREEVAALADPIDERVTRLIVGNGHGHYEEHIPDLDAVLEGRA